MNVLNKKRCLCIDCQNKLGDEIEDSSNDENNNITVTVTLNILNIK